MRKQTLSIKYVIVVIVTALILGWWLQPKQPVEIVEKSYQCEKNLCTIQAKVRNLTKKPLKAMLQIKAIDIVTHSPGAQTNKVMTTKVVRYSLEPEQIRTIEAGFKVYAQPHKLIWFAGEDNKE